MEMWNTHAFVPRHLCLYGRTAETYFYAVTNRPEILTLWPLLNFQKFLETRQVGREGANMTDIWHRVSWFVLDPVGIAFPIEREDVQSENSNAFVESLVQAHIVEGLTQLFSNDRVFLDPELKEAIDLLDTWQFGSEPFLTWYRYYIWLTVNINGALVFPCDVDGVIGIERSHAIGTCGTVGVGPGRDEQGHPPNVDLTARATTSCLLYQIAAPSAAAFLLPCRD